MSFIFTHIFTISRTVDSCVEADIVLISFSFCLKNFFYYFWSVQVCWFISFLSCFWSEKVFISPSFLKNIFKVQSSWLIVSLFLAVLEKCFSTVILACIIAKEKFDFLFISVFIYLFLWSLLRYPFFHWFWAVLLCSMMMNLIKTYSVKTQQ